MDFAAEAAKMAVALVAVIGILIGGVWLVRRFMGERCAAGEEAALRVLGGLRLGAGKSIILVDIAGQVLVLGSTAKDLTCLAQVDEAQRIEQLRNLKGQWGVWGGWTPVLAKRGGTEKLAGTPPVSRV